MRVSAAQAVQPSSMASAYRVASPRAARAGTVPAADELLLSTESLSRADQVGAPSRSQLTNRVDGFNTEDIRAQQQLGLSALQDRLQQLFSERGIDTSSEIRLQTGPDGRVIVAGEHPQKAEIEALFVEFPELRNQFAEVDAQSSFLRAADEAIAFQAAYREDPLAAVEEFSHLFDGSPRPPFSLMMRRGAVETEFGSVGA